MTDAKHTPGPWVVDREYPLTVRPTVPTDHVLPDGTPQRHAPYANVEVTNLASPIAYGRANVVGITSAIAYYDGARRPLIDYDGAKANARLIAAAPELLEALKALRSFTIPGMNWTDEIGRELLAVADAAIDKAEAV